jgi:serine/threonine protein kinase
MNKEIKYKNTRTTNKRNLKNKKNTNEEKYLNEPYSLNKINIQNTLNNTNANNFNNENVKRIATIDEQFDCLKINIKRNIIFYIIALICCYLLAYTNINNEDSIIKKMYFIFRSILTFIACATFGHAVHWLSHHINVEKYISSYENIITQNKYSAYLIKKYCDFIDFHSMTHHDSSINKQPINILYEIIQNFIIQSVGIVFCIKLMDFKVVLLWGLLYTTLHNVNYLILRPSIHRDHHKDVLTNYGIDIMDILFNTKYDWNDIENYNHMSINLIIITSIIIYFYKKYNINFKLYNTIF